VVASETLNERAERRTWKSERVGTLNWSMENLGDEWLVIYLIFTLLFGRNRICQTRYAHHMAEILMSFPAANSSEFVARLEGVPCPSQRIVDRGTTSMASLSPFRRAHSFLELSSV
jgi:hypothetical protein